MLADPPGVRHDPLRSSGRLHEANRFQRGVAGVLRLPLLLTIAFCLGAVGVSLLDRLTPDGAGFRTLVRSIVSEGGAIDFLSAVATSLLAVTSITFSVLLLAVQQTASSLTPVVFDQFLRRTANQVYFGFLIGATAFSSMFAVAIVDERWERLVMARDRLGIKPLYIADLPGRLRFASTLPALVAGGGIDTSIDQVGAPPLPELAFDRPCAADHPAGRAEAATLHGPCDRSRR
jgi:hypothetical protein